MATVGVKGLSHAGIGKGGYGLVVIVSSKSDIDLKGGPSRNWGPDLWTDLSTMPSRTEHMQCTTTEAPGTTTGISIESLLADQEHSVRVVRKLTSWSDVNNGFILVWTMYSL